MNQTTDNLAWQKLEQDIRKLLEERKDLPKIPLLRIEVDQQLSYDNDFRLRLYLIVPDDFLPTGSWEQINPFFDKTTKPVIEAIMLSPFFKKMVAENQYDIAFVFFKREHE